MSIQPKKDTYAWISPNEPWQLGFEVEPACLLRSLPWLPRLRAHLEIQRDIPNIAMHLRRFHPVSLIRYSFRTFHLRFCPLAKITTCPVATHLL